MSHPEIIENCKKVIIEYLLDEIGQTNLVSVILYGSVARSEESYKHVNGKLYLESDIDVLVVVKNTMFAIKTWLGLKRLCNKISNELRKNWLLSLVTITITTENRLLNAPPNVFYLAVKLTGQVIFGKELIELMPSYENEDIPAADLFNMIFAHMIHLVRAVALSGILQGKETTHGCNSVLKSIRKLTLFMVRAMIIKYGMPINAFNLNEIKSKKDLQIKIAVINELLRSYDDIKLSDCREDRMVVEVEKCLVRVIEQFNLTISVLAEINYPFTTLPKKLIFDHDRFLKRMEYGMYLFLTNVRAGWNLGLFKFVFVTLFHPEDISWRFYYLFVSSANLINSTNPDSAMANQQRQTWLRLYNKSLQPWKYDVAKSISLTQSDHYRE